MYRWSNVNSVGEHAVCRLLVRVGYHEARTPGGGVYRRQLDELAGYLEDIEERLNDDCIRGNDNLDRFDDPYLRGDLTDDILEAMQNVVIYTSQEQVPTAYRDTSRLCDPSFGVTPPDRSWVGICREIGADELTLLHELYHYAAADDWGSEERAFAISNCDPVTGRGGCYASDDYCAGLRD